MRRNKRRRQLARHSPIPSTKKVPPPKTSASVPITASTKVAKRKTALAKLADVVLICVKVGSLLIWVMAKDGPVIEKLVSTVFQFFKAKKN